MTTVKQQIIAAVTYDKELKKYYFYCCWCWTSYTNFGFMLWTVVAQCLTGCTIRVCAYQLLQNKPSAFSLIYNNYKTIWQSSWWNIPPLLLHFLVLWDSFTSFLRMLLLLTWISNCKVGLFFVFFFNNPIIILLFNKRHWVLTYKTNKEVWKQVATGQ